MIKIDDFRVIDDFPKKGIKFYDITPILNNADTLKKFFDELLQAVKAVNPDVIVAMETRGYFFGPSIALALNLPFVPVRKKGKLPYKTYCKEYKLEYGMDAIEIHEDAMGEGKRVLLFDDILATGGTANAAISLLKNFNPSSINLLFIMELKNLNGRQRLGEADSVQSLLSI